SLSPAIAVAKSSPSPPQTARPGAVLSITNARPLGATLMATTGLRRTKRPSSAGAPIEKSMRWLRRARTSGAIAEPSRLRVQCLMQVEVLGGNHDGTNRVRDRQRPGHQRPRRQPQSTGRQHDRRELSLQRVSYEAA